MSRGISAVLYPHNVYSVSLFSFSHNIRFLVFTLAHPVDVVNPAARPVPPVTRWNCFHRTIPVDRCQPGWSGPIRRSPGGSLSPYHTALIVSTPYVRAVHPVARLNCFHFIRCPAPRQVGAFPLLTVRFMSPARLSRLPGPLDGHRYAYRAPYGSA